MKNYKIVQSNLCSRNYALVQYMINVFIFQSLVKVVHARVSQDGLAGVTELGDPPSGVITRGMLK